MGIYLHSKLENTMIYLSCLNKGHQPNLDHYILGDLLSDTSCILWNFYGWQTSYTNYMKKYYALSE